MENRTALSEREDSVDSSAMELDVPPTRSDAPSPINQPSPGGAILPTTRRRPIPSKGHRKSRNGCFSCKRRKVKCSEERPVCRDCLRMDFVCDYPPSPATGPAIDIGSSTSATAPNTLKYEDLRFFHHLLVAAFPAQPNSSGNAWSRIASMSHQVRSRQV